MELLIYYDILAAYPADGADLFPEVTRPGREADHSLLSSAEVNNNKKNAFCIIEP
jgi:hypothetical protein